MFILMKNVRFNATVAKSNKIVDSDFIKILLPLINTFVSQLMEKIIESLSVIINSFNIKIICATMILSCLTGMPED